MAMWLHTIKWTGVSNGTMPDPVYVIPTHRIDENVFKTASGKRRRKRKGIWASYEIRWALAAGAEIILLNDFLWAEYADSDTTPFALSLDGSSYHRAAISEDPDIRPIKDTNVGLEVTLKIEFYDRVDGYPNPIHGGA